MRNGTINLRNYLNKSSVAARKSSECPCDSAAVPPPPWVRDMLEERKRTGGFSIKRSNLCPDCNMFRSVNGTCGCE